MRPQDQYTLMDTFSRYLTKQNKRLRIASLILVIIFSGMLVGGFFIPAKDSSGLTAKYAVLGFFLVLVVLYIGFTWHELRKYNPDNSLIIEAIKTRNGDNYFVWIYSLKRVVNGAPSYFIVFMGMNKKRYQVQVKTAEEFEIIGSLQAIITNVTYGYSDSIKKQYQQDPHSLVKR